MTSLLSFCTSCLGLNRRAKSHELDESDALLDDQQPQYGSIYDETQTEIDEEELIREREALDQITNEAADRMINVSHPHSLDEYNPEEYPRRFEEERNVIESDALQTTYSNRDQHQEGEEEDDEAAWLASCNADITEDGSKLKGLNTNAITIDMNQLRNEETRG